MISNCVDNLVTFILGKGLSDDMLPRTISSLRTVAVVSPLAQSEIEQKDCDSNVPSPFKLLPESVGLRLHNVGNTNSDSPSNVRALRKELPIQSMLRCILPLIPVALWGPEQIVDIPVVDTCDSYGQYSSRSMPKRFRIVDFAGGTETLAIALALVLPQCYVILVDLKAYNL